MHKPDHLLEAEVREELRWDPKLNDSRIVVKAHDGLIILSGAVDTFTEAQRALDDAGSIGGVKAVDNQLLVGPEGALATDSQIAADCMSALGAEALVPHGAVTAAVKDSRVTLSGKVHHDFQRRAARHAVAGVAGVAGVTDQLSLTDEPIATDIAHRIDDALARKALLEGSHIQVTTTGHTVVLDGAARSRSALTEAVSTAWSAPGVTEVVDHLVVGR